MKTDDKLDALVRDVYAEACRRINPGRRYDPIGGDNLQMWRVVIGIAREKSTAAPAARPVDADRAVRFLAGLVLVDQPVSVQRERDEIVRAYAKAGGRR